MAEIETQDGFLRRAGILLETGPDAHVARLPVSAALCSAPGLLRVGALAMLADAAGGIHAVNEFQPDWPVTADFSVHTSGRPTASRWVAATSRMLKRRRAGAVFEVAITDDGDRGATVATSTLTFTTLSRADPTLAKDTVLRPGRFQSSGAPLQTPLEELLVTRRRANGDLELDVDDSLRNAFGAVAGGIVGLLGELEGEAQASAVLPGPAVATGMVLYFLSPGKVGPVLARSRLLATAGPTATLQVTILDGGADDRLMAEAVYTYQTAPAGL